MVRDLELQAAVNETNGFRADDVRSRAHLAMGEGFRWAQVGRRHAEMREHDLTVRKKISKRNTEEVRSGHDLLEHEEGLERYD